MQFMWSFLANCLVTAFYDDIFNDDDHFYMVVWILALDTLGGSILASVYTVLELPIVEKFFKMCKPDTHWHNLVYLPALIFVTFFLIMLVMASIRLEWQVGVLSDEIVATKESIRLGSGEQTQVHTHSCVGSPQDIQEASENFFSLWMTARITEVYQLGTKWALQVSTHMRTPVRCYELGRK